MRLRLIRSERGEASVFELMLVLGLFLLPAVTAVAQVPRWIDARSTAELAAQEAARDYALSAGDTAAVEGAAALARRIVANHGFDPEAVRVDIAGVVRRGAEVRAAVTIEIPAIVVPPIGHLGGGFTRTYTHVERVDDYGVVGGALDG